VRRLRATVLQWHGFLYEDGDAYAVYHAVLQTDHPSTAVDLALSFGSWAEDATAADRTRVGIRIWPEEDELKCTSMTRAHPPGRLRDARDDGWS
jgi:hypothetical protein